MHIFIKMVENKKEGGLLKSVKILSKLFDKILVIMLNLY